MSILKNSFSKAKILSEITRDIGQVFFASMFVAQILSEGEISIILIGLFLSILSWILSLQFASQ